MKLISYELKKIFSHNSIKYIIITLICFNILGLFIELTQSENILIQKSDDYHLVMDKMRVLNQEEQLEYLQSQVAFYQLAIEYREFSTLPDDMLFEVEEQEIFKDAEFIQNYEKLTDINIYQEFDFYNTLYTKYYNVYNYPSYIQQVSNGIENIQSSSIWNTYPRWKQKDYLEMEKTYQRLSNIDIEIVNTLAITQYISSHIIMFFPVIIVLILCMYIFQVDDMDAMDELIYVTKNGGFSTAVSKLASVLIVSVLLNFILAFLYIFILSNMYGRIPFSSTIQSIPILYESPHNFTIWEWLLYSLFLKSLVMIVLGFIISCLFKVFHNKVLSIAIFVSLLLISATLYYGIDENSIMVFWKYANLYAILDTSFLLSKYLQLSFFNRGISIIQLTLLISLLCSVISVNVYLFLYGKKSRERSGVSFNITNKLYKNTKILVHEFLKLTFMKNAGIIFTLCLIVQGVYIYQSYKSINSLEYEHEQVIYNTFDTYGGFITEEKEAIIETKKLDYEAEEKWMAMAFQDYRNNRIDAHSYNAILTEYRNNSVSRHAFNTFYEQYQVNPSYVIYARGYRAIFSLNTDEREFRSAALIMFGLILLFSGIYTVDQENDEDQLYTLTYHGKKSRMNAKWKVVAIYASLLFLFYFMSEFLLFRYLYPMNNWLAPFNTILSRDMNIALQWPLNNQISLLLYWLMLTFIRVLGTITTCIVCTFISKQSKKQITAIILCMTCLFLPTVLELQGLDFMRYFSLFDMVMGNRFLYYGFSVWKILLIIIVNIVIIKTLMKKK